MNTLAMPAMRPARSEFSSGPCAKRPGWNPENLGAAVLGRSHRSKLGKGRLKAAIDQTRAVLRVPDDYLIGIVPGSDTGAVEMALWSLLGPRPVQLLAFESFGKDWVTDVVKQLKIEAEVLDAPYGRLPDLSKVRGEADLVFTWNGTTSGVRVPNGDFIAADFAPLKIGGGYDQNFVLGTVPTPAARFAARVTAGGLAMEVLTTEPGIQLYTGNWLGAPYTKHGALCLETQHFADSPNKPGFPSTVLRPGGVFTSRTLYRFAAA